MPRYYYIILLLIISTTSVYALPNITMSSQNLVAETYVNSKQNFEISFSNNGSDDAINFTCLISSDAQYFTFPIIENVSVGNTVTRNISILTDSVFEKSYVLKISYVYYEPGDYIPKNYVINTSSNGYSPTFLEIKRTDNVTWINQDSGNHTIRQIDNIFDSGTLEPSNNWTYTFNSIGLYNYYDAGYSGYLGKINVTAEKNMNLIHSPNLDLYFILQVKSSYSLSSFDANILNQDLEMQAINDARENILQVFDNSTVPLYLVDLSVSEEYKDWIIFSQNKFNVSGMSSKIVNFIVSPKINMTSQTNKTHHIDIVIKPENSIAITKRLNVFIKYANMGIVNIGNTTIQINELGVDETISFCLARPDYVGCERLLYFCKDHPEYGKCKELYKERIIEVPASYNISGDKIEEMVMSVSKTDELMERQDNKYNIIQQDVASVATRQSGIESSFKALIQKVNDNERIQADNELKAKRANVLRFVMGILLSLFIGIFMLLKFLAWHGTIYQQIRQSPGE